ncbi:helix-turn-helix domain-containing protein [Pedobacter sp. N23S346]|uniref:helix-turn-helix domain-containing protein n=1 Tax=Pedobacter sp. N23S346 TaxID=3402750 RepID=UPI003AC3CE71
MYFTAIIEAIKLRRNSLKVTQETLSDLSGVAIGAIKKFESGRGSPTLITLQKLSDTLGLEITLSIKKMVNNEES